MDKRKSISPFEDKKIETVDFVFENCEVYTVPADGIHKMVVSDIHHSFDIHVNGLSFCRVPGEISHWTYADYFSIMLNEKGMNTKSCWEDMFECSLLKDRILRNDITHLDFNFDDGTNLYIGVPWEDGESEWVNKYQHNDVKEKFAFIDISKDIDEEEFKKVNADLYEYETFESKEDYEIKFSDNILKNDFEDIEILHIDEDEEETFGEGVPNYVQAAFRQIDEELSRVMWNINQQEFESPFDNTGNEFKNDVFEVEAYSWDEEYNQKYNFKWGDYKVRWYKHSRRDPEANRFISPEECAQMLDECLESIIKMDIDEDDLFEEKDSSQCLKCGNKEDLYPLKSGVCVCKECLDNLGKEQNRIREEVIDSLFEFGFDNYEDVCNMIETFEDIIKFIQNNIDEELSVNSLINILWATRKVTSLQEGLLNEEEKSKILYEFERFYNKSN